MPANFLHGVETITIDKGGASVREVKSAVVGLIGTAPIHELDEENRSVNQVKLILNEKAAAMYAGQEAEGYTLPTALKAIFAGGGGVVLIINVFDPDVHKDEEGNPDPTKVTAADIIGAVSAEGIRSGLKLFESAYSVFGFYPKLIHAPVFNMLAGVAAALDVTAEKCRGDFFIDAPIGTSLQDVIQGRGTSGTINFQTSSKRGILCYPHVKAYNPTLDAVVLESLSNYAVATIVSTDANEGFHVSPSNHEIKGIVGMELDLTAQINDPLSEVNILNENGILTIFNSFGSGFRLWGNRSAAWPSNTKPENFICVSRTSDMIEESIEFSSLQFVDKPGSKAWIDSVVDFVNRYLNTLKIRGAILDGRCWFPEDVNTIDTMAQGQFFFDYDIMPPTPAERITFRKSINTAYLATLLG